MKYEELDKEKKNIVTTFLLSHGCHPDYFTYTCTEGYLAAFSANQVKPGFSLFIFCPSNKILQIRAIGNDVFVEHPLEI